MIENAINIQGQRPQTITLSDTEAVSDTPLMVGIYAVWSDVDCKISIDQTSEAALTVTISDGFPIKADNPVLPFRVASPSYISGIAAGAGTLYYQRVD